MLQLRPSIEISVELTGSARGKINFLSSTESLTLDLVPFLRGAQGERGLPGFSTSVVAQEPLGGHRAVTVDGLHADPEDANRLAGISLHAGTSGETVDVIVKGPLEEGSWNWTPDAPIFIGASGVLTQNPSTSGLLRRIAWAVSATAINVDIMPPVLQA